MSKLYSVDVSFIDVLPYRTRLSKIGNNCYCLSTLQAEKRLDSKLTVVHFNRCMPYLLALHAFNLCLVEDNSHKKCREYVKTVVHIISAYWALKSCRSFTQQCAKGLNDCFTLRKEQQFSSNMRRNKECNCIA